MTHTEEVVGTAEKNKKTLDRKKTKKRWTDFVTSSKKTPPKKSQKNLKQKKSKNLRQKKSKKLLTHGNNVWYSIHIR